MRNVCALAMGLVCTLRLRPASDDDSAVASAVNKLRALKHRMRSYTERQYSFGDHGAGVRAVAKGPRDRLLAWTDSACERNGVDVDVVVRRFVQVPYLDWSAAKVDDTRPVTDILITNKLHVRVSGMTGSERVDAELDLGDDVDRQVSALRSVCDVVGFTCPGDLERVCTPCA